MTDKPIAPRSAPMNRMMSDDYEKRGVSTAHIRRTVAERAGQTPQAKEPQPSQEAAQSQSPKSE